MPDQDQEFYMDKDDKLSPESQNTERLESMRIYGIPGVPEWTDEELQRQESIDVREANPQVPVKNVSLTNAFKVCNKARKKLLSEAIENEPEDDLRDWSIDPVR